MSCTSPALQEKKTPQEQAAQKEEAFARATVALTRAQQICVIMGSLDMRVLVGAATIMGCLKYGVCFSRLKDEDLLEAPDDSAFLQSLRFSCAKVLWGALNLKVKKIYFQGPKTRTPSPPPSA